MSCIQVHPREKENPARPSTDARSDGLPCEPGLGQEGETQMLWIEGGPSKAATLLSTGVQGTGPRFRPSPDRAAHRVLGSVVDPA